MALTRCTGCGEIKEQVMPMGFRHVCEAFGVGRTSKRKKQLSNKAAAAAGGSGSSDSDTETKSPVRKRPLYAAVAAGSGSASGSGNDVKGMPIRTGQSGVLADAKSDSIDYSGGNGSGSMIDVSGITAPAFDGDESFPVM